MAGARVEAMGEKVRYSIPRLVQKPQRQQQQKAKARRQELSLSGPFEAIRNRIVPLGLHLSAKSLHIRRTSTLLFGTAQVAGCASSLGKSNRRQDD